MTIPFPTEAWDKFRTGMQYLADEPRRLYMGAWFMPFDRFADANQADPDDREAAWFARAVTVYEAEADNRPPCGTAVCAAGAILVSNGHVDPKTLSFEKLMNPDWGRVAITDVLGLDRLSDAGRGLAEVFETVEIETYTELVHVLEAEFTFPGPLPTPKEITA